MKRYCIGCKIKHESELWQTKGKHHYCRLFMDCAGCGTIHERSPYIKYTTKNGVSGWFCEKFVSQKTLTPEQKAENMSPAEVMSGVHYGMDKQDYGAEADTMTHTQATKEKRKNLEEALAEA